MSKPASPVPPTKAPRTVQEIQNEYSNLCAKAGHLQYQIATLGKDLDLLNAQLRDLNFEAASAKNNEEAVKAAAAKEQASAQKEEAPKATRTRKAKLPAVTAPPADDEVTHGESDVQ
jgi:septal ring factor EnvC (AmiA/AmiB activator)